MHPQRELAVKTFSEHIVDSTGINDQSHEVFDILPEKEWYTAILLLNTVYVDSFL